jgi:uncharacterized protein (UPF0335 family)
MPPYVKSMMKQMEPISLAFQEQTKTNSILAGTINMIVEIFARIEERISSVQKENTDVWKPQRKN